MPAKRALQTCEACGHEFYPASRKKRKQCYDCRPPYRKSGDPPDPSVSTALKHTPKPSAHTIQVRQAEKARATRPKRTPLTEALSVKQQIRNPSAVFCEVPLHHHFNGRMTPGKVQAKGYLYILGYTIPLCRKHLEEWQQIYIDNIGPSDEVNKPWSGKP